MTKFQIEFEGRVEGVREPELDSALDSVMDRLVELGIADPSVSGVLLPGDVRVEFVLDATSTEDALERAHSILREVTAASQLAHSSWHAARAESLSVPTRATL